MWYFTIKQQDLSNAQYQSMQKFSELAEVEIFNEPYYNFCLFEVEASEYKSVMDYLDMEGVIYVLSSARHTRDELLDSMQ